MLSTEQVSWLFPNCNVIQMGDVYSIERDGVGVKVDRERFKETDTEGIERLLALDIKFRQGLKVNNG